MVKSIYDLKLHEKTYLETGSLFIEIIRVAGGWIYSSMDKGHNLLSSVYVPFHNEFQQ